MKARLRKSPFATFLLFLFFLFPSGLFAQTASKEAVIGCPDLTEKLQPDIQHYFQQMTGVQVVNYLKKDQLFLLKYDPGIYSEANMLVENVHTVFPYQLFLLKEGATHRELLQLSATAK